jgi:hypothetical protein
VLRVVLERLLDAEAICGVRLDCLDVLGLRKMKIGWLGFVQ